MTAFGVLRFWIQVYFAIPGLNNSYQSLPTARHSKPDHLEELPPGRLHPAKKCEEYTIIHSHLVRDGYIVASHCCIDTP